MTDSFFPSIKLKSSCETSLVGQSCPSRSLGMVLLVYAFSFLYWIAAQKLCLGKRQYGQSTLSIN